MKRVEISRRILWIIAALVLAGVIIVAAQSNYGRIAVLLAPAKIAASTRTANAIAADTVFWQTLHGGVYEQLPNAIEALTRAYVETPQDAITAAHLGWLHLWRVSEAARLDSMPATITDDIVLARKYFEEAVALDPSDAR